MIDCSKTENYLKEKARLCESFDVCDKCPICDFCVMISCESVALRTEGIKSKEIISIVQKWSDEHPQKTYADDLLEKFPSAPKTADGIPKVCRDLVYGKRKSCNSISCFDCWNEVMPE